MWTGNGIGLGGYRRAASLGPTPVLSTINFDLADSAGGDSVTLTGTDLTSATSVTVGGTSSTITANTATSLTFTMPAKTAGSYDVVVTTAGGASNALTIEAWAPTDDAACTLLFDCVSAAYNAGAGTWAARYSSLASSGITANGGSGFHSASGGAPVFDGNGAVEGGLVQASRTLSGYIGTPTGGEQAGSIAAVYKSTNTQTIQTTTAYNNPAAVSNSTQGTVGLGFGRLSGTTPSVVTHIFNSAYRTISVAAAADTFHAVVSRWGTGGSTSLDLSLNGALTGGGYATTALTAGTSSSFTGVPIYLGVNFNGAPTSTQTFAGTIKAFAILNTKASDTFVTKFYKWAKARHGVA